MRIKNQTLSIIKTINYFILIILVVICFTNCGIRTIQEIDQTKISVEAKSIPPEFSKFNGILLFANKTKKFNRKLQETLNSYYKGKYEFVDRNDIESEQYSDINKFRYVFDSNNLGSGEYNFETEALVFYIWDRKENETYIGPAKGSNISELMRVYIIKLQEQLDLDN